MPDRWIRMSFDGKRDFCNAAGYVQGGILSAMLDGAMGAVVFVTTDGKLYNPTISLTVNFLAPAKPGLLIVEAKVTQLGKSIAFVEGRLTADDGTLLATASAGVRIAQSCFQPCSSRSRMAAARCKTPIAHPRSVRIVGLSFVISIEIAPAGTNPCAARSVPGG
jgi:uncharacterized protein (TIGR00369 family)